MTKSRQLVEELTQVSLKDQYYLPVKGDTVEVIYHEDPQLIGKQGTVLTDSNSISPYWIDVEFPKIGVHPVRGSEIKIITYGLHH